MLRYTLGIPAEHSDFECSDGHWAFHQSIQIANAQMGNGHSTEAFRFRMLRWALGIPVGHLDFESSEFALDISPYHSDFKC